MGNDTAVFPPNMLEMMNGMLGGWDRAMGLRFVGAEPDEIISELTIGEQHTQPYGLLHGGVHAGIIETTCSAGAAVNVFSEGKVAVGLENNTSFLRAVRGGKLRCTARVLSKGRRSHVWEARVEDDRGRLVATGRVRLLVLEPGAELG